MTAYEVNFDGLIGPTHNYSGLSLGNEASLHNVATPSNPREAAKQGLHKMQVLHVMGIPQAILPPQERPAVAVLRRLGFSGSDAAVLAQAAKQAPRLFLACCSASSMWTANAASVSPSADTQDGRVHFTPANLISKFHRAIESPMTARILRTIFADPRYFVHHPPLPGVDTFGDEGAANRTRLCTAYGEPGVECFVFGKTAFADNLPTPQRYPARQTLEASQAVSRLHGLNPAKVVFAQQNPAAIDAGVFHNDVIAVGNQNVLFYHQEAFLNGPAVCRELQTKYGASKLHCIEVESRVVSLQEAVGTYLFNSQLITLPDGTMTLLLPRECEDSEPVRRYLEALLTMDNPITRLEILDLRQSMRNGGGPACLRLRVVLTEAEFDAVNQGVLFSETLYAALHAWIDKHYRDRLSEESLRDPQLLNESHSALDELTGILQLGSIYSFQQV